MTQLEQRSPNHHVNTAIDLAKLQNRYREVGEGKLSQEHCGEGQGNEQELNCH